MRLTCWLPDNFAVTPAGTNDDDDVIEEGFIEDYCKSCDYYFDERDLSSSECHGMTDHQGNRLISATVQSRCPCYTEDLWAVSWPCPEDYNDPYAEAAKSQGQIELSPMAFAVDIEFTPDRIFAGPIKAWCQAVSEDGLCGERYQAGNTHGDDRVCWGNDNDDPDTLATAVVTYGDAPGNNDLLNPAAFASHRARCRADRPVHPLPGLLVRGGYDALLLATRDATPAAYLLLRGSGVPADDGLIVIGLKAINTTVDGTTVSGYATEPACGNRRWLLINDPERLEDAAAGYGLLLGQLPPDSSEP